MVVQIYICKNSKRRYFRRKFENPKNPNTLTPQHNATILCCGNKGLGKTQTLLLMTDEAINFLKIYLEARKT